MPHGCPGVSGVTWLLTPLSPQLQQSVRPHYLDGRTINGRMRAILVDWLVQVHSRFHFLQETLYMCVAIMDRFLQVSDPSSHAQ